MSLWLCGFSTFFVFWLLFFGCGFCHLGWDLHFSNGALCKNASSVRWHVEFYAWELRILKKKTCLIRYPVSKGYVFKTAPQCQQGPSLAWAVDSAACFYCCFFFVSLLRFCLFHSKCWPENCDEKTCTARNCQILFKNRRLSTRARNGYVQFQHLPACLGGVIILWDHGNIAENKLSLRRQSWKWHVLDFWLFVWFFFFKFKTADCCN